MMIKCIASIASLFNSEKGKNDTDIDNNST